MLPTWDPEASVPPGTVTCIVGQPNAGVTTFAAYLLYSMRTASNGGGLAAVRVLTTPRNLRRWAKHVGSDSAQDFTDDECVVFPAGDVGCVVLDYFVHCEDGVFQRRNQARTSVIFNTLALTSRLTALQLKSVDVFVFMSRVPKRDLRALVFNNVITYDAFRRLRAACKQWTATAPPYQALVYSVSDGGLFTARATCPLPAPVFRSSVRLRWAWIQATVSE